MDGRKKEKTFGEYFLLGIFIFLVSVVSGILLCEYNCNSLLGVKEPIKSIGFWQPEVGTYCLNLFGNNYQFRQIINYGSLDLGQDKIYLTLSNRVFAIPTRINLIPIKNVIKIMNK